MQNKGIVICTAVLLTLASIFYLSFSAATHYYDSQAAKIKDPIAQQDYKDSVKYLGIYSYQKCLETQIGLGLDLKGGMNVILEISVPDVVETLADHKTDPAFTKSMKEARAEEETSQRDFITLFVNAFKKNAPGRRLAEIFATQQLQGKVSPQSTDSEVEKVLRDEVQSAIDNSFNVVRTRIDKFGVVQPNIQKLEGQTGRIMVEMPGIKEPERMRKLLQGSANLEFWETYNAEEIIPYLQQLDSRMAGVDTEADTLKADTVLQEKLKQLPNVDVYLSTETKQIIGDGDKVTAIRIADRTNGEEKTIDLDGIFVQIGLMPNSGPFADSLETTPRREIKIDEYCRTSLPGVYAAGDVSSVPYKQIVIAMGEGAKAALSAFEDRMRT